MTVRVLHFPLPRSVVLAEERCFRCQTAGLPLNGDRLCEQCGELVRVPESVAGTSFPCYAETDTKQAADAAPQRGEGAR